LPPVGSLLALTKLYYQLDWIMREREELARMLRHNPPELKLQQQFKYGLCTKS